MIHTTLKLQTIDGARPDSCLKWDQTADQPGQADSEFNLYLKPTRQYQRFEGFGGAFSEIGGRALLSLPEDAREDVLRLLYGADGANLSWGRIPVGASDFALDAYSALDSGVFDLSRDRQYLLPFLKSAIKHNPQMRFQASPWSPPACLKDNHSMVNGGKLINTPENLQKYASYLADYIQAMAAEGVAVERFMPQNEPDALTPYPSCLMSVEEMADLVADYLCAEFRKRRLTTEIWAGTFRTITGIQGLDALENDKLRNHISGLGVQYSTPSALAELRSNYPDFPLMHTESACYDGRNTVAQSILLFDDIIDYLNVGCRVYTYWNTILPQNALSSWGWKQNSLVSVMDDGSVRCNPDFSMLKFWSRALPRDARRISGCCLKRKYFAAILPNGNITVLLLNRNAIPEKYIIHGLGEPRETTVQPYTAAAAEFTITDSAIKE